MSKPTRKQLETLSTCAGFAQGLLDVKPYEWTRKVFFDLDRPGARVALKSANGAGKTSVVAASAALWHMAAFKGSLTIATAATFRQIAEQFMPGLRAHAHRFKGWEFLETSVRAPNGSRLYAFSTDSDATFQGWHAPTDSSLLIIADECAGIGDEIFNSIMRCQPTRLLLLSSPGGPSGFFHAAFTSKRKFFRTHSVSAFDCPHISRAWIHEQIELHGADSPLVASMIRGEFMTCGEGGEIIPLAMIEKCLAEPPAFTDGEVLAGCDFAAGKDSNALALLRGNRVEIVAHWRESETMRAVGRFVQHFRRLDLKPSNIAADEGGMGRVFCDALKEAGWPVRRFNFGATARDSDHYGNEGAELWFELRRRIEKRAIVLPHDEELIQQLSTRRAWPDSRGRLTLESKADARSRGQHSPDKADALLIALSLARQSRSQGASLVQRLNRFERGGHHVDPDHPFHRRRRGTDHRRIFF